MMILSLSQRFSLLVRGYAPTRTVKREGWKVPHQLYLFRCPAHGLVEVKASGNRTLRCPLCLEQLNHDLGFCTLHEDNADHCVLNCQYGNDPQSCTLRRYSGEL